MEYLKANVKMGEPVVVTKLYNDVFKEEPERRALNRLFNTFFKIPLFVAQTFKATGEPPSLAKLAEQFAFTVPGTADVILRVMESDPRVPRFFDRDPGTGEITTVHMDRIVNSPRFGKVLERTITGWEGKTAPAFKVASYRGEEVSSTSLAGKPYLVYFWFTNCPPCLKTSPVLVELEKKYSGQGFSIIGFNSDRILDLGYSDADRDAYASKLGIKFTLAHATEEAQTAFGGVSVFPTLFFVDRNGIVVRHFVNGQNADALEQGIQLALK